MLIMEQEQLQTLMQLGSFLWVMVILCDTELRLLSIREKANLIAQQMLVTVL